MELSCPQCATRYRASEEKIPPGGGKVRCPKCEAMIVIDPQTVAPGAQESLAEPEGKPPEEILSEETADTESVSAEPGESAQEVQPEGDAVAVAPDVAGAPSAGAGEETDFLSSSLAEQEEQQDEAGTIPAPPATAQEEPREEEGEPSEPPLAVQEEGQKADSVSLSLAEELPPEEPALRQEPEEEKTGHTRAGMRRWAKRFKDRLPRGGRIPRPLGLGLAAAFLAAVAVILWQSAPTRGPQAPAQRMTSSPSGQPPASSVPPSSPQQPLPPGKEPALTQPPESLPVTPAGPLYPLEPFLVPLTTGAKEDRFLKVTMALELSSGQVSLELDDRLTTVREQVLAVLNSRTLSSFLNLEGKNQLRSDLIRSINQQLSTGAVRNLYFTEFIVL
ncbi:MAG: zinc-ribbon domain-containing protein [Candidatus Tectomicrobia bacterium]|uniref:Flagellar protein FliL n=1 Tax=Tectimicrobiota bacterium TaxID=2528274 RepID=A0A932GQ59_UNCTE|nr:zinc-ribbon domain-containing protein [Candidatus Tectomicrobia bacterium]